MRWVAVALLAWATTATASVPPMPPAYIWKAGEILSSPEGRDPAKAAPLFADDVRASENGNAIGEGKAAWLRWRAAQLAHYNGHVVGFSESSGGQEVSDGGELLVVDTYDTVDRTNLPPGFLVDPRMASRSTLYQFGRDGLIHAVRIERTGGFWMAPRP